MPAPSLTPNPASALQALQGATGAAQSTDVLNAEVSQDVMAKYKANQQTAPVASQQAPVQSPEQALPQPDAKNQQAAQKASAQPGGLRMMPVASSTIKLVGYDPKAGELHMQFKSSPDTYVYSGVPPDKFEGLMKAKSKGLFHSQEIKGKKFPFRKVKPVPPQL